MTGTDVRTILAKRIKALRRGKKFSQAQLAEKADISIPFLSAIERGTKWPYPETLAKLADALDVAIADLFLSDTSRKDGTPDPIEMLKFMIERQQQALAEVSEYFFSLCHTAKESDDEWGIL